MRMLLNNLDPDVAEDREQLIVYGGAGKAARNREALFGILDALKKLENDETLLVQSGKAGRSRENASRCAARADRQFQSGSAVGHLAVFPRT